MLNGHDIHISYLPLAHMFERVIQVCVCLQKYRIMKSHVESWGHYCQSQFSVFSFCRLLNDIGKIRFGKISCRLQ